MLRRTGASAWIALLLIVVIAQAHASTDSTRRAKIPLRQGWTLQSSCKVAEKGEVLSSASYRPSGWLTGTVPATVLAAQVAAKADKVFENPFYARNLRDLPGTSYPEEKVFAQLPMPADSPYNCSWWYRTEFRLPAAFRGKNVWLNFGGINYRANVWVNGKLIANQNDIAGAYRTYELNVTNAVTSAAMNVLAVEVFAPTEKDLGINWVDWAPAPPDKDMGLWREVFLTDSGEVTLRNPQITSKVDTNTLDRAELTVSAEVRNTTDKPVKGNLSGQIEKVTFTQPVELGPNETKLITFAPEQFAQLKFGKPRLWWPWQMGAPNLYALDLKFEIGGQLTDEQKLNFGIREVKSEFTDKGARVFSVNGKRILIRGGGWAPDLMMREDLARVQQEFRYVKDMGLNTIRLEGKMETDAFYDLADRQGVLIMAGWCCCDIWEQWKDWPAENKHIATESLRSQLLRMRNHPSVFVWLNGSDNPPAPEIEQAYLEVEKEVNWPNPVVSSATQQQTSLTGPSGVKMTGPYDWVPPEYWLIEKGEKGAEQGKHIMLGGAYGFNTETSPGPAIPPTAILERFIPKEHLWPVGEMWNYHAGLEGFPNIDVFRNAMNARYGEPRSLAEFQPRAEAMAYEGERAMFEAYARNKYGSTGVIQWMLNNAWPSIIWHLYDYYMMPAGGYFGTKKANEPLHVLYGYDDRGVWVVNSTYAPVKGLRAKAIVMNFDLTPKFTKEVPLDISEDGTVQAFVIPEIADLSTTYFVKLELTEAAGKRVSDNFYWLSTKPEQYAWDKSDYRLTPVTQHGDLTALGTLPAVKLSMSTKHDRKGNDGITVVRVKNPSKSLAFMVRARVLKTARGEDILPVRWSDNYLTLMPGEEREITATYAANFMAATSPIVQLEGWNIVSDSDTGGKAAAK
ncbi:MAG TPA: beta galactosidase jelly roll domain-containing protein [Terriglobales bacterium]|nr:beta galactosidase jelly roll domain-containing protein [Terriglobales bacterium]